MVGDEVMTEIKLCKDCKHSKKNNAGYICNAPANMTKPSLVDGISTPGKCGFVYCQFVRGQICFEHGEYWEPKVIEQKKPCWKLW